MGPTSCGKSTLAIHLRSYLPIELISVDSALIYRDMNIGTSKPSASDLLKHPHRLLNIKDPTEKYSIAEFQKNALKEIQEIIKIGKIPCLVGGTMLYYHTLLYGLSILPESNINIRNYILQKFDNVQALHNALKSIDPISAHRIHKNDTQRLLRALEVFYISGKTITELQKNSIYTFPYQVIQISLLPPNKEWLNDRIQLRLKKMFILGLQKEVEDLFLRKDINIKLPSMKCIGYRQIWEYLEYYISYEEMFNKIIYATRKLAKHQLTWLHKWKNIYILNAQYPDLLVPKILDIFRNTFFYRE